MSSVPMAFGTQLCYECASKSVFVLKVLKRQNWQQLLHLACLALSFRKGSLSLFFGNFEKL